MYREVPTERRQYFESPCLMRLRLLVLAGRSLSELIPRMAPGWGEILVNEDYE